MQIESYVIKHIPPYKFLSSLKLPETASNDDAENRAPGPLEQIIESPMHFQTIKHFRHIHYPLPKVCNFQSPRPSSIRP